MIENANIKSESQKILNIKYTHATIFDDRLVKGSFDVILAFYILHLIKDSHRVLNRIHELLKPDGLLISTTPCMGEKPFLNAAFSVFGKIGVIPEIKPFKKHDLENLITRANFNLIESESLYKASNQRFIVAKK